MLVAFDKGPCPQYLVLAFCKMDAVLLTAWAQRLRVGRNPEVRAWIPSPSLVAAGITPEVAGLSQLKLQFDLWFQSKQTSHSLSLPLRQKTMPELNMRAEVPSPVIAFNPLRWADEVPYNPFHKCIELDVKNRELLSLPHKTADASEYRCVRKEHKMLFFSAEISSIREKIYWKTPILCSY